MSSHLKMVIFLSLGLLAVFAWHFATVFEIIGTSPQTRMEFFVRFGIILVLFVIASAVTAIFVGWHNEDAVMPDEREEKIELKVDRDGLLVVYGGMVLLMWFVFTPMTPMQVANALLAIMCFAEIVKIASGLAYLHGGARS